MSYFDRQGIPKKVLSVHSQEEIRDSTRQKDDGVRDDEKDEEEDIRNDDTSEASDDDMFEEAVDRLRSYSFVSLGKNETFEMYGLVQLATRKWLAMCGDDEKWKAQFSRNLNALLPNGNYENWARCEMLFPHAKSAQRQRPTDDRSVEIGPRYYGGWMVCILRWDERDQATKSKGGYATIIRMHPSSYEGQLTLAPVLEEV
ncbi:hypothetical protein EPUS_08800 [Endocarpon pusillum Z07020]|uniref:Uncharacterized protein n=1 Tax=Endocarpon pusillum (strain Z07020 / HMAS-L-300199) TaxID=1263415 RepID=U1GDI7_ENDPU|nr:uncharacterized protein EPUS_08800 [Endocarpon pusillum Z07020]ERF75647.1 hypothetical protein EPUS_08800 [Endocarpon pusillum Z07020]